MKKQSLQQQLEAAKKKQNSVNNEVKAIELKIAKEVEKYKPLKIFEKIKTLLQVYKHLKVDPKKDIVKVDGFDKEDHKVILNLITRMRIAKVYNNGIVPKKGDRRYYPWCYLNSSGPGLVFDNSTYVDAHANTGSAARLAFLSEESSTAYAVNFKEVEEGIIGL